MLSGFDVGENCSLGATIFAATIGNDVFAVPALLEIDKSCMDAFAVPELPEEEKRLEVGRASEDFNESNCSKAAACMMQEHGLPQHAANATKR